MGESRLFTRDSHSGRCQSNENKALAAFHLQSGSGSNRGPSLLSSLTYDGVASIGTSILRSCNDLPVDRCNTESTTLRPATANQQPRIGHLRMTRSKPTFLPLSPAYRQRS